MKLDLITIFNVNRAIYSTLFHLFTIQDILFWQKKSLKRQRIASKSQHFFHNFFTLTIYSLLLLKIRIILYWKDKKNDRVKDTLRFEMNTFINISDKQLQSEFLNVGLKIKKCIFLLFAFTKMSGCFLNCINLRNL